MAAVFQSKKVKETSLPASKETNDEAKAFHQNLEDMTRHDQHEDMI